MSVNRQHVTSNSWSQGGALQAIFSWQAEGVWTHPRRIFSYKGTSFRELTGTAMEPSCGGRRPYGSYICGGAFNFHYSGSSSLRGNSCWGCCILLLKLWSLPCLSLACCFRVSLCPSCYPSCKVNFDSHLYSYAICRRENRPRTTLFLDDLSFEKNWCFCRIWSCH